MHSEIADRYIDQSYITLLRTAVRVAEKYVHAQTFQDNLTGKLELTATVASIREYEINNNMVEH